MKTTTALIKNILVVSHSDYPANSAIHVHHFANELVELGLNCVVSVPHSKNSINTIQGNLYPVTQYDDLDNLCSLFKNQQPPDIVHCWTPREHVRIYCYKLSLLYNFKLVIHLEDNEESIIQRFTKVSIDNWVRENDHLIPYNLSHPLRYKDFMASADGVTVIIDKLSQFIPNQTPYITLYPGVDTQEFYPRGKNQELIRSFNIPVDATILCYTGNVHLANLEEVKCLYLAVGKRNQEGKPTFLIRTGIDNNLEFLGKNDQWIKEYVIDLGWVEREKISEILALADVLVQPGESDDFNDYRFPSKIPEFLAMGKPVIMPDTNIGKILTHEENAFILPIVNEKTLPPVIDLILENELLRDKLSKGAWEFALKDLNWRSSTEKLLSFYQTLFLPERQLISLENALRRVKIYSEESLAQHLKNMELDSEKLEKLTNENNYLRAEIEGMKSSKFWRLREKWFKLKDYFGLGN